MLLLPALLNKTEHDPDILAKNSLYKAWANVSDSKGKDRSAHTRHQRTSPQCFLCMDIETWWSQVPSTPQGFICMNWPAWGTFVYGWRREEFVIVSEWKTGEETITEGVVSYLHSTLTLGFVPLQRTGRIRTRNRKECFSKRLDETQSPRSGFICSISGSCWVCLETAALA